MLQNSYQDRILSETRHWTALLDVPVHGYGVFLPIPYVSGLRNISQR